MFELYAQFSLPILGSFVNLYIGTSMGAGRMGFIPCITCIDVLPAINVSSVHYSIAILFMIATNFIHNNDFKDGVL